MRMRGVAGWAWRGLRGVAGWAWGGLRGGSWLGLGRALGRDCLEKTVESEV